MIIKLTNASADFKGKPVLLNAAHMLSFFENTVEGVVVTTAYSNTKEAWNVSETPDEILELIRLAKA
jgi:hypothetical protein